MQTVSSLSRLKEDEMSMEGAQTPQENYSNNALFLRGFFIRLLYGSLVVPVYFLIRPGVFREENLRGLFFALCAYLLICTAGGAYDVANKRKIKLWQRPRIRDVLLLTLVFVAIMYS